MLHRALLLVASVLAPHLSMKLVVVAALVVELITIHAMADPLLSLNFDPSGCGRVIGPLFVIFVGTTQIGSPLVSCIAQPFGARVRLSVGGVGTIAAWLIVLWAICRRRADALGPRERIAALASGLAATPRIPSVR